MMIPADFILFIISFTFFLFYFHKSHNLAVLSELLSVCGNDEEQNKNFPTKEAL
jgi:hypothetical protein